MFSVEIDKFKRMMDLRRARYKHDLEVKFPELKIEYGDRSYIYEKSENTDISLCLTLKEDMLNMPFDQCSIAKKIRYILTSDVLKCSNSYIESIYMYDDENASRDVRKRVMNNVDMLWSLLFKTSTPDGLTEEELLSKCLGQIDRCTSNGPLSMYTSYRREPGSYRFVSDTFANALVDLDLDIAGASRFSDISKLKFDHCRIAPVLIAKDEAVSRRWSK